MIKQQRDELHTYATRDHWHNGNHFENSDTVKLLPHHTPDTCYSRLPLAFGWLGVIGITRNDVSIDERVVPTDPKRGHSLTTHPHPDTPRPDNLFHLLLGGLPTRHDDGVSSVGHLPHAHAQVRAFLIGHTLGWTEDTVVLIERGCDHIRLYLLFNAQFFAQR
jgi:hypothetical protein